MKLSITKFWKFLAVQGLPTYNTGDIYFLKSKKGKTFVS